jgi:two-component system chemotaxis response regulator CheY
MPSSGHQNTDADLKNLHILIVDDDTVMLDMVEALLKSIGVAQVTRATSGLDALGKLGKTERVVDCILCDYTMSQGNGLQLLQAIRLGQVKFFRADACFILVTASGAAETVAMAAELDVSGYLVKPATPEKLRTAITKARARAIRLNFQKYSQVMVPHA